jgi:hypothetical protein
MRLDAAELGLFCKKMFLYFRLGELVAFQTLLEGIVLLLGARRSGRVACQSETLPTVGAQSIASIPSVILSGASLRAESKDLARFLRA